MITTKMPKTLWKPSRVRTWAADHSISNGASSRTGSITKRAPDQAAGIWTETATTVNATNVTARDTLPETAEVVVVEETAEGTQGADPTKEAGDKSAGKEAGAEAATATEEDASRNPNHAPGPDRTHQVREDPKGEPSVAAMEAVTGTATGIVTAAETGAVVTVAVIVPAAPEEEVTEIAETAEAALVATVDAGIPRPGKTGTEPAVRRKKVPEELTPSQDPRAASVMTTIPRLAKATETRKLKPRETTSRTLKRNQTSPKSMTPNPQATTMVRKPQKPPTLKTKIELE